MESLLSGEAGLFLSAFISSTIAPGGSEAWLSWMVAKGHPNPMQLILIATAGNTLGALTTWGLGYWISCYRNPEAVLTRISATTIQRVRHWGIPILLLSWMPVVGDAFCLAAGWLRFPLAASIIALFIGKLLRYWFIAQLVGQLASGQG